MKLVKEIALLFILSVIVAGGLALEPDSLPLVVKTANKLESHGQFKKAESCLSASLPSSPENEKRALRREIERIRRIRLDYDTTQDEILKQCTRMIKDFKSYELHRWESEGKFDARIIDSEKYYFSSSVRNLAKRYPEIRVRFKDYAEKDTWGEKMLEMARGIKAAREKSTSPYVVPLRLHARQSISPKKGKVKAGELVRCWMPYPRECPYQKDIKLVSANPKPVSIDKAGSVIRSVYFEATATDDASPAFTLEYEYTSYGVCPEVDPEKVIPYGDDLVFTEYIKEQPPHIVFTPELKDLAQKIVGSETNPYLKGKKIYDWVSENIVYSYAHEYSTLLNIPMYVYENRYGDCGQIGLLFITLCRIAGVPAGWRSGWECMGGDDFNMHDWAAIYIKPYGWIPVDAYMGVWTMHESTLPLTDRGFLRDFYYGNIDPWRLEANAKNNALLSPPKKDFRSETVDFQRGEIEADSRNLYFGEFVWRMHLAPVKRPESKTSGVKN